LAFLYTFYEIIQFIKDTLDKKGVDKVRSLGKLFRQMESFNGTSKVNKDEFLAGLRDQGVSLQKLHQEVVVEFYNQEKDGNIDFVAFLKDLRGKPKNDRVDMINKAFSKFDKDSSGFIDLRDLRGEFCGKNHPKVVSGEITEDQAFALFLKNFSDRAMETKIGRDEWDDYYYSVSDTVENDNHFIQCMKSCWNLN